MFYQWQDSDYSKFIIAITYHLAPRTCRVGERIASVSRGMEVAIFMMKGQYKIGFYDLVSDQDDEAHWHELEYMKYANYSTSKLNAIGDYPMFCAKESAVAYLCTQEIEGYALSNRDWRTICQSTPAILYQGLQASAMRKHYNLFMTLKRAEYPSVIRWYQDQDEDTP